MRRKTFNITLKSAFLTTIPVLMGYMTLGIAFGILFSGTDYNFLWAGLMSVVVYAGSMQFFAVSLLAARTGLAEVALMTLMVNLRHMVYGLSMLGKFKNMGKRKHYMIFSLTDETYALLCGVTPPPGCDEESFYFLVSLLNQIYWVSGSVLGAVAGSFMTFDTKGIDFAMTALFLVICVEQWKGAKSRFPAFMGAVTSVACLALFGPKNMLLPAMVCILTGLVLARPYLQKRLFAVREEGEGL